MGWLLLVPGLVMLAVSFAVEDDGAGGEPAGYLVGAVLAAMFVVRSILRARHRLVVEVPEERAQGAGSCSAACCRRSCCSSRWWCCRTSPRADRVGDSSG